MKIKDLIAELKRHDENIEVLVSYVDQYRDRPLDIISTLLYQDTNELVIVIQGNVKNED